MAWLVLVILALTVHLGWVFWKIIKKEVSPRLRVSLNNIATDARWWVATLLVLLFGFVVFPFINFKSDVFGFHVIDVAIGACIGVLIIVFSRSRLRFSKAAQPATAAVSYASQLPLDGQTRLDLIHLLEFSINETTFWMLDRLLDNAHSPEVTDGLAHGQNTEEAHVSRQWFTGYVRQEIGAGTHRQSDYLNVLHAAQGEAERELESIPPDQRPPGIDQLALRRYMTSDLQFRRSILFLQNQKREIRDRLVSQRHSLIERSRQRSDVGA